MLLRKHKALSPKDVRLFRSQPLNGLKAQKLEWRLLPKKLKVHLCREIINGF